MGLTSRLAWTLLLAAAVFLLAWQNLAFGCANFLLQKELVTRYNVEALADSSNHHSLAELGLKPKKPIVVIEPGTGNKRTVHGRFLHITDFHPDPYYKPGSDIDKMCHGGKGKAGKYGDAILGCDAPLALVEDTLDWIADNLKDKIDFIVWTGDNMRHDNDRNYPRSELDIFEMNGQIADLMRKKFGDMPIPSLGNNDVYPHNLCAPGPTLQTRELFRIWRQFVPQAQLHVFNRGVYFFQEVIPNKLAVLSINTLFLFQSNPLVDSCDRKKDPGYKLFLWLGYVLKEMRLRNMKVWLTGHVPPTPKNYDISCLRKYILWSHEYRDVIIGGLYGHMNMDHFLPLDSRQAYKSVKAKYGDAEFDAEFDAESDAESDSESDADADTDSFALLEDVYAFYNSSVVRDTAHELGQELGFDFSVHKDMDAKGGVPQRKVGYMKSVREGMYANIKGRRKSGVDGERYSIVNVATSVVPTFNPGFRVWEYNISDLYETDSIQARGWDQFFADVDRYLDEEDSGEGDHEDIYETFKKKKGAGKRDKSFPSKMPKGTALGPAYVPQLFTPERYAQYYLDLKAVNKGKKDFAYEVEYTTDNADYEMQDLTVSEWLKLGRKLGSPVKKDNGKGKKNKKNRKNKDKEKGSKKESLLNHLWQKFLTHSFASSDYENLGYG